MRRQRKPTTNGNNNDTIISTRSKGRRQPTTASSKRSRGRQQIIPTWVVWSIVVFFILLGIASEHYHRTRNEEHRHEHITGLGENHNVKNDVHGSGENNLRTRSTTTKAKTSRSLNVKSMLTPEEDDALEYDDGQRYHLIFSTDCSKYQHWQSYLVFFSAMKIKQPGHVTRIVSGCTDDEAVEIKEWFEESVQIMSPKRFHLHMTPKFSEVKDENGKVIGEYSFFNKPYGLRHFLENFSIIGFRGTKMSDRKTDSSVDEDTLSRSSFQHEDDIVILIDPDMALLRPITKDFSKSRETVISEKRTDHILSKEVQHGVPFAQTYGLGTQWQKFDLDKIAGKDSPAKEVNQEAGRLYFPVGPPYIGTVRDMYRISVKWSEFVPRVHEQYPYLLAEMYAFCIAAAHLGLKHQIIDSLMISNPDTGGEGWSLIDQIPPEETCDFAREPDHNKYALPSVIHACQRYSVGKEWFFGKRRIPKDIYDCDTPLFEEPPSDLALLYDFKWPPNAKEKTNLKPKIINQETFMVCSLTRLLNDASDFFKSTKCPDGGNKSRSRKVADLFREGETKKQNKDKNKNKKKTE